MAEKLTGGDPFPPLALKIAGGGTITVPDDFDTSFTLLLFYRGYW